MTLLMRKNGVSVRCLYFINEIPAINNGDAYQKAALVAYVHTTPWSNKHREALLAATTELGDRFGIKDLGERFRPRVFDRSSYNYSNPGQLHSRTGATFEIQDNSNGFLSATMDGRGGWSKYYIIKPTRFMLKEAS